MVAVVIINIVEIAMVKRYFVSLKDMVAVAIINIVEMSFMPGPTKVTSVHWRTSTVTGNQWDMMDTMDKIMQISDVHYCTVEKGGKNKEDELAADFWEMDISSDPVYLCSGYSGIHEIQSISHEICEYGQSMKWISALGSLDIFWNPTCIEHRLNAGKQLEIQWSSVTRTGKAGPRILLVEIAMVKRYFVSFKDMVAVSIINIVKIMMVKRYFVSFKDMVTVSIINIVEITMVKRYFVSFEDMVAVAIINIVEIAMPRHETNPNIQPEF
ncbi:hypothetical protein C8J57DRAFT_1243616 [Mycena rebaudengoi]|nr:hypothetical protein C8J57DRAFT_1243616 [Mycena rebaudengoi]